MIIAVSRGLGGTLICGCAHCITIHRIPILYNTQAGSVSLSFPCLLLPVLAQPISPCKSVPACQPAFKWERQKPALVRNDDYCLPGWPDRGMPTQPLLRSSQPLWLHLRPESTAAHSPAAAAAAAPAPAKPGTPCVCDSCASAAWFGQLPEAVNVLPYCGQEHGMSSC